MDPTFKASQDWSLLGHNRLSLLQIELTLNHLSNQPYLQLHIYEEYTQYAQGGFDESHPFHYQ